MDFSDFEKLSEINLENMVLRSGFLYPLDENYHEIEHYVCAISPELAKELARLARGLNTSVIQSVTLEPDKLPGIQLFGVCSLEPYGTEELSDELREKLTSGKSFAVDREELETIVTYLRSEEANLSQYADIVVNNKGGVEFLVSGLEEGEYGARFTANEIEEMFCGEKQGKKPSPRYYKMS